jgi:hypothetical protein
MKAGRPEHIPTPEQRVTIKEAAGLGIPLKSMCYLVGLVDDKVLVKHYAKEIGEGKAEAGQFVTRRLRDKIDSGDTAAITFYCKTQLGWREKDAAEPPPPPTVIYLNNNDKQL